MEKVRYMSVEVYVDDLIKKGLLNEDLSPKKCICGCTDFEQVDEYHEEHWIVEYSLKCKQCGQLVGHWAYGNWQI